MEPNPKTPDSLDNPVDQGQIPVQPAVVTGNLDSPAVSEPPYQAPHPSFFRYNRTALLITAFALILIVLAGFGGLFLVRGGKGPTEANQSSVAQEGSYAVGSVNSPNLSDAVQLQLGQASSLAVNGQLQVNDNLVLAPTAAPDTPVTGEVYYDKTTNQPYYYNGAAFISLAPTATPEHVTTLGGAAGVIGLGDGLTVSGNQLSLAGSVLQAVADIPSSADVNAPRVSSLQGLTGAVTFTGGPGISINGTTITGTGVNTLTASTSNLVITHDADGNYSIADNSGGGGAGVVLGPASPQTDATNNPSISINKTGTADLLNLENNGTPVLTVSQNGAIASGAAGAVTGALELANSGSSKLATLESAALNQNTVYVLPDPGAASATICLSTGNCAGAGGGITGSGTAGDLAKFSGSGTITSSNLSESGSQLSYAGNLVVDAGGGFSGNVLNLEVNGSSKYSVDQTGNTIQAGTLTVNGTGGSTIAGTLTVGAGLTVTTGGLTVSAGDVTLGALGAGLVQSSAGGLLSSGAVDRNDNTYFSGTLSVANGGTGTGSFTSGGILYGGTGAIAATGSADNSVLATNGSGVPSLVQTLPLTVQGNITALGAVTSGSIGSGFGTISTGNNITTTAGLQGGTLTVTGGSFRVDASGNVVTTGTLAVQGSGGITIGVPGTTTGSLLLANSSNSHTVSLQGLAPSGQDETIIIPASTAATDEVCLETLGNCSGAGSSVASSGGNQYYIPVFSNVAATQITNSQLYNNSTGVSVGGSSPSALFNVGTSNQFQVSSAGGVTATGITSSGSIQFSGLNSAGVVHTNSLGQLSTSLVVLGTDTSGDYVADLGALTGLTTSGNSGAGSKPSLSVTYGSAADTAVQGGTQLVCASGSGNLTGGGNTITLGAGGTCSGLTVVDSPTFSGNLTVQGSIGITVGVASNTTGDLNLANAGSADLGTVQVAALGQSTTYILPDPDSSSATICLNTGNCAGAGNGITGSGTEDYLTKFNNAGGNQIGDSLLYDNGSGVSVGGTSPAGLFNVGTSNQFQVSSAGALQATGITSSGTIQFSGLNSVGVVHTNASGQLSTGKVVLGTDTSGNYVASLGAPTGLGVSGNSGAGSTPVLSVLYGDTADTAVQGSTAITCPAGTGNLTGGGNTITLGAGGACGDLTVVDSPTFAGTLTVQGAGGITVGVAGSTAGVVNLANTSNAYLSQIEAAAPSGTSNAVYTLPAIASSDTICLQTLGNCSGSGGLTGSGTAGDILKYATSDTVTDSGLSEAGTTLTYAGNAVVNAATGFSGNLINLEVGTSSPTSEYSVNQAGNSIQAGTLTVNGTGASSVAGTLSVGTLGAAGTTVLCEAGGQLETCNSTAGSGNFIFNQSASAQTANFDIAATTGIAAQIKGDASSDILDLLTSGGATVAQFTAAGNVNLGASGLASTLQIGNTTGAVVQTINLGNNATASSSTNITIGSLIGASTTTIQGGTGSINLTANGSGNTGVIVKNSNNSAIAFQVQNAAGATVLTANTTNQNVTVGAATTVTGNSFMSTDTESINTGIAPSGEAQGNLCNNGKSDLAVANDDTSGTVSLYCNTGSLTTPYSSTATMTLTAASGSEQLTAGNLCNNGRTDIAVTNYTANTVYIYCNTGSTGSAAFSSANTLSLTTSTQPDSIATGNFCNNGRTDLAVTNWGNASGTTANVYCNTGSTGSASFGSTATENLTTGGAPDGVSSGNYCNNGRTDIAIVNALPDTVYVYCNTGSTGSAAFSSSATISLNTGSNPRVSIGGNLCNNGRTDVAITNLSPDTTYIYCNTGSTGSAAFSSSATISLNTGSEPQYLTTGNLCGNGKTDLVVTNSDSTTGTNGADVYCNTGSTGLAAFSSTATQTLTTGSYPADVIAGNLCNANRTDLGIVNNGLTTAYIYCNQIPAGGAVTGTLQVVNAVSSNAGIFVQGATGQTADLLDVYTNNNVLLDNINTSGDLCVALGQTCGGTSALQVNGTGSFGDTLNVGISNNDVALQANTTGTGNLLQLENSGSNVLTVDNTGDLAAGGSISLGTLGAATGDVLLCFNSSNQIAACSTSGGGGGSGGGAPFVQGGNSFGAEAVLGTNDDNSLALETNGTQRAVLDTSGNLTFQQSSTITAAANATANTLTLQGGAASGTDTAGGALNLNGGQGTGAGAGGNINFNIAPAGSSGSSLNAVGGTPVMSINGTTGAVTLENAVNTDAFQIQNASGTDLLDANTSSGSLTLGTPSANIWLKNPYTPSASGQNGAVAYNGYLYELAGTTGSLQSYVYYAPISSNGSTGAWSSGTALPQALQGVEAVASNGYLYAIGGYNGSSVSCAVYYAQINPSTGALGSWTTSTNPLTACRTAGSAIVYDGYLYYVGGQSVISGTQYDNNNVYYAQLNASTGGVGSWTTSANTLPGNRYAAGLFLNDGYLYIAGGCTTVACAATATVYDSQLSPTGGNGAWAGTNSLPAAAAYTATATVGTTVYAAAGTVGYYATLNGDGSISAWSTASSPAPGSSLDAMSSYGNYVYDTGLASGAVYYMLISSLPSQGVTYLQETQGSTTAFQIQDAGNNDTLDIDTTNDRLGINTSAPTAKLDVETGASNDVSIIANTSGTGNLLQLENAGTNVLTVSSAGNLAVNGSGNGTTVGALFKNATNSTTAFEIQNAAGTSNLLVADTTDSKLGVGAAPSSTGSLLQVGGTLSVSTLGTTGTSVLCYNATDQISSCGSAAGSGSYIYNQSASAQTANFDIAATTGIAAQIKGDASSDILDLLTSGGATVAQFTAAGNVNLGASGLASTIQIGNTTGAVAQTINLGNNATASSSSTVTIGSQIGASTTTIQGGTGSINLTANGSSNTGVLVKNTNNSSVAFQVQNASGATVLTANTTNQNVTVGTAATSTGNPFTGTDTQSLTAGTGSHATTTGNFCNNNRADLAVTNEGATTAYIYCNTGSVTTPFSTTYTISLTTGTDPYTIASGNFCNNNRADLAVTNYGSATAYIYCNTGSTGSAAFSATYSTSLTTGSNPTGLSAGNLCNNGLTDLAVSNYTPNTAYIYCNTGSTGSAAFSATYSTSLTTSSNPGGIVSGNLCNNSRTDLAITNAGVSTAYIYCNTGSTGSAAFSATYSTSLTTGTNPQYFAAGNLCNNGRTDLAVTNGGPIAATADVYCNTGSTGSAAFAATRTQALTTSANSAYVTTANLCGNGKADLAIANGSSNVAYVYCNTGSTGSAAFAATATQSLTTGLNDPYGITAGNLCNANRADLAVTNYGSGTAYVYCNQIPVGGIAIGALQVINAIDSNANLLLQGAASQTADLLDVYDNSNVLLDNINASGDLCVALGATCNGTSALQVNGPALFETPTNSTTAFQIQNAAGTSNLFVADTTDSEIGINQTPVAAGAALQVTGGISVTTGGLAVTAGGETITAGGETIQSGGLNLNGTGITNAGAIQGATTYSGNNTLTLTGTGANELAVTGAPPASTSSSLVQFGNAITDGSANGTYIGLNAPSGNTADLLNLQNNGSVALQVSSAGALTTGSTINGQTIGSTASFTGTLTVGDLTNAGSTVLCETGGELGTCGSAAGSGSYIYNQSAGAQSANFDIQAVSGVAAQIQGSYGSDILDLFTSTNGSSPVASFGDDGQLTAVGVNAGSGLLQGTGGLNITGDSNFTGDIAATGGYTQTGSGANTFTGATTVSGALDATGTALFQNAADSTTAFQIQNAAGDTLLDADTTDQSLTVTGGSNPAQPVQVGSDITTGTSPWDVAISGNYAYVLNSGDNDMQVFDISNPADVTQVGSDITTGADPNAVTISGNYAYVLNSGDNDMQVFDISNPADVTQVGSDITTGNGLGAITVSGNYAYVVGDGSGLQIFNISNPNDVTQVGNNIATESYPDSVAVSGNYAYVVGSSDTLLIFNISNPASVTQVGSSIAIGAHPSDVVVSGNYAYVLNEYSYTMQIFNISNPASVTQVGSNVSVNWNPTSIAISGNYAYVVSNGASTLQVFNISNPASVTQVGSDISTGANPYSVAVSGNYVYVVNGTSNTLQIFNINPAPTLQVKSASGSNILSVDATGAGNLLELQNAASGADVLSVSNTGGVVLENSTNSASALQIQNAAGSTLFNVDTLNSKLTVNANTTVFQNAADSTTAFQIQNAAGDTLLDADTTDQSLTVTGGSNPAQPVQVGSDITTGTSPWDVAISGNYAYVVDYTTPGALQVFNISNPADVTQVGSNITTGDNPYAVAISGNYAYVINQGSNTLQVFNISNPADVTQVGSDVTTGSDPDALAISGNYAYVTNQNGDDLQIFNISNPASVTQVGSDITTGSGPVSVAISGNYAYVIDSLGLQIFNISNPVSVTQVGSNVTTGTNPWDVAVSGNYAYVLNESSNDMQVFNISNPADVTQVGSDIATGSNPWAITISGNDAYVADTGSGDMQVFNISNPAAVTQVGSDVTTDTNPDAIVISGNYAYVTNAGSYTMQVFNMNPSPTLQVNTSGGGNVLSVNATGAGNILTVSSPSTGGSVLNISSIGAVALQNTIDSTSAFQIQNASAADVFNVDTANGRIGVGTAVPTAKLDVETGSSNDVSLLANTSGTGDLLQLENSGTNVASVSNTGAATFQNSVDSTTAFQVQNAAGDDLLTADTANMRLGVDVTYASMSAPTGLSVGSPTSGGSLTASTTYYYEVTAIDSAGGETTPSTEASGATDASGDDTLPLTWTAVTGASGYRVYRATTSGGETYLTTVLTNSFTDTGSVTVGSAIPPSNNTAYVSTNVSNDNLQLSVGGLGTPTGQLYVSGTVPSGAIGTAALDNGPAAGIYTQGSYAYITNNGSNTFQIFDVSNPASPVLVSTTSVSSPDSVYVQGRYAYLITGIGLQIFDISNPASPVSVGNAGTEPDAEKVYVEGQYAYVVTEDYNNSYLQIFNISNPAAPQSLSTAVVYSNGWSGGDSVDVSNGYAYVTSDGGQLQIFNVTNPANPVAVSDITGFNYTQYVQVVGSYAYVTDDGGIYIYDISNPANPVLTGKCWRSSACNYMYDYNGRISVQGRYAYVADSDGYMAVLDISNPANPVEIGVVPSTGISDLAVAGRYAYVVGNNTLQVFDLGGEYTQQLQAGTTETGTLQVDSNATISGDESIQGGLNVGQSIQATGNLGVSGGASIVGSMNLSGGNNIISAPSAPTVTPEGATGSTTYSYTVTAINSSGGQTTASPVGTTTTGNATLSSTNYNQITWTTVTGASSYDIYRTAGGSSTGLVGSTASATFNDTGLSASGSTPTTNTTAQLTVQGAVLFKNSTNSTTAFQIQDSSGASVLTADTTDHSLIVTGASANQSTLVQAGSAATGNSPSGLAVQGDFAYVVNYESYNLEAYNIANPNDIYSAGTVSAGINPDSVAVSGNYAYVSNGYSNTLYVYNISNPASMTQIGNATIDGGGNNQTDVAVSGNYVYVTNPTTSTLQVFNVSDPTNPTQVGSNVTINDGSGPFNAAMSIVGNDLYIYDSGTGYLQVFNISNPASVSSVGSINTAISGWFGYLTISGNYAYVTGGGGNPGFVIVNISNPASMSLTYSGFSFASSLLSEDGGGFTYINGIALSGNNVYISFGNGYTNTATLNVDISNPASPVGVNIIPDGLGYADISGNYLYGLNGTTLYSYKLNTSNTLQVENASGTTILGIDATGAGNLLTLNSAITGSSVLNISNTGAATFENAVNSTTAFQIQNSSGSDIFDADTQDGWIGIGTSAPGNLLSIGALTTASSGAQIAVSTSGTTNSGIVVQDVASQSSGYAFQLQSSSGTSLASIDYQGNLAVQSATITGILTVNGHIVTGNTTGTTTATININAGTAGSPSCTVSGDDTAGQITLTTGTAGWAAGAQCTINFSADYAAAPHPVIAPASNTPTAAVSPYVTSTATTLTVNFINADTAQHTYTWNYFNAQ